MPSQHIRVGYAGAFAHKKQQKRAADCSNGGFYKSPTNGQTVDSLQTFTVSWDTSCMNTQQLDMYLYVPSADNMRIHYWKNIDFTPGTYDTNLMPRWWNDTASTELQIQLVPAGSPPWKASLLPSGPVFTATYNQPASGAPAAADVSVKDNGYTDAQAPVSGAASSSHLSGGKIAAAVIMPLLAIVAAITIYLFISRKRGLAKRKEWTEQVDKRMSTISADWKSLSAAGANAAIRQSMAINRNSVYSFNGRPTTVYSTTDGGQAGVGARGLYNHENGSIGQMSQLRPGLRTSAFENRVSRVSFADAPRPSLESRRSRALHTASTYEVPVPPLPKRQDSGDVDAAVGTMSPRQANGAVSLTADDIRARIDVAGRNSTFDEVLPALSLMRTGGMEDDEGAFVASDSSPSVPEATHPKPTLSQDYFQTVTAPATTIFSASPLSPNYPTSPVSSNTSQFGMVQPLLPANLMSPDDMLRAYAERNAAARSAGMLPTSTGTATPTPSTYSLGAGTGFGANNTGITYPTPAAGSRRSLIPAGPGAYSPSRGAYGVSSIYDEGDAYSVGLAE